MCSSSGIILWDRLAEIQCWFTLTVLAHALRAAIYPRFKSCFGVALLPLQPDAAGANPDLCCTVHPEILLALLIPRITQDHILQGMDYTQSGGICQPTRCHVFSKCIDFWIVQAASTHGSS